MSFRFVGNPLNIRFLLILLSTIFWALMSFSITNPVFARDCSDINVSTSDLGGSYWSDSIDELGLNVSFDANLQDTNYKLIVFQKDVLNTTGVWKTHMLGESDSFHKPSPANSTSFKFHINSSARGNPAFKLTAAELLVGDNHGRYVFLYSDDSNPAAECNLGFTKINGMCRVCELGSYTIRKTGHSCTDGLSISQMRTVNGKDTRCYYKDSNTCFEDSKPISIQLDAIDDKTGLPDDNFKISLNTNYDSDIEPDVSVGGSNGKYNWTVTKKAAFPTLKLWPSQTNISQRFDDSKCPTIEIKFEKFCPSTACTTFDPQQNPAGFELCNQIPDSETTAKQACRNCVADQDKVWTAVGCISKEPKVIIAQFITIGLGIGGGVALIMIIAGGFMLTISQGNPQKTNEAKEMITSAIIGLLFVIFSVVILQFIGVTIFRIPGFGEEATP